MQGCFIQWYLASLWIWRSCLKQSRRMKVVLSGKQIMMMSQEGFLINIHDVGNPPPPNTAFWLEHMNTKWSIKRWHHWCHRFMFLVLKCLHQFYCNSCQKQGSPSTIIHFITYPLLNLNSMSVTLYLSLNFLHICPERDTHKQCLFQMRCAYLQPFPPGRDERSLCSWLVRQWVNHLLEGEEINPRLKWV